MCSPKEGVIQPRGVLNLDKGFNYKELCALPRNRFRRNELHLAIRRAAYKSLRFDTMQSEEQIIITICLRCAI